MSRPPTPSSGPPTRTNWRFEETGYPSEWAEDYRPGCFQPVHVDDEFDRGRYRIIRKLGYGSFSTVWLAHDKQASKFVALKVMKAKASLQSVTEKSIGIILREKAKDDALGEYVVALIDTFEHRGPNGVHTCLTFEPMGPSAAYMIEELPSNQSLPLEKNPRYPKELAKVILKHALSGIAFLHKYGVVHGDIQPGNMLFNCADLTAFKEDQLRQPSDTISPPLQRLDGKTDLWAPKYIAMRQPLVDFVDLKRVKLSDLGSAFWSIDPPSSTVTPIALRSPELIFHEPFDRSIDIWAFGCLIYEFLTGMPLFSVILMGDDEQDEADDDHINDLIDVLGPLPETFMSKWSRSHLWIGPHGERLQPLESEEDDGEEGGKQDKEEPCDRLQNNEEGHAKALESELESSPAAPQDEVPEGPFINHPLEKLFDMHKPDDIDTEEAKVITGLIRQILQYDPSLRPTAEELLQHPWF